MNPRPPSGGIDRDWPNWKLALLVVFSAAGLFLAWQLADIVLLAFGALIVATILYSLAELLNRFTGLPMRGGILVALVFITLAAAAFFALVGVQILTQLQDIYRELPQNIDAAGERLGIMNASNQLDALAEQNTGFLWNLVGIAPGAVNVIANTVLVMVAGVFIAAELRMYRNGLVSLVPAPLDGRVGSALDNAGRALKFWLAGKLFEMVSVGLITTAGLYLIGMPSALGLGFIAGLLEFIPFFGPIMAALPALLLAMTVDPQLAIWTAAVYVAVQQIENNLIVPLVQKRTVELPPALGLFSIFAFGVLFGTMGVLFSVPLAVVIMVFVKQLYLRDVLDEETHLPGELGLEEAADEPNSGDTVNEDRTDR